MVFTDIGFKYFSLHQSKVRISLMNSRADTVFEYRAEPFFDSYKTIQQIWQHRESQRNTAISLGLSRNTIKEWEDSFIKYGTIGLMQIPIMVEADPRLEKLVILLKSAYPHINVRSIMTLAQALNLPNASIELIRRIQRSYGYGQRQDSNDISFYSNLQKILESVKQKQSLVLRPLRSIHERAETFINYDIDPLQHKVELFKRLSLCEKKRKIRPILRSFGIQSSRYYELKQRYKTYGIWGLVDLIHIPRRTGEKISPELESKIIEQRLMNPSLSPPKITKKLDLNCSLSSVKKIYSRWELSKIKHSIPIKGIVSLPIGNNFTKKELTQITSAKSRLPDLTKTANLKVDSKFLELLKTISYRNVPIANPGAIILAPFLDQLGIVEAVYTYGPETLRTTEITNDILINVLRIIAGFPTINNYMQNSDYSVSIGAGKLSKPGKSAFYRRLDELDFKCLNRLRNDLALRAKELNIIQAKEIALDYHCDPSDSRYPHDKRQSKSPDKSGNMVFAHRPHLIWDSTTNTIINIAYCEGRSRAPTALYNFLEDNLFNVIDPSAISEIYADSEYTGEKQLVYLHIRSGAAVTMCLKQNKKIKIWKEETIRSADWKTYGKSYRIATRDYILPETGIKFRFVVKQNIETNETRCFGSTNVNLPARKILDRYHIRWPVESGIKDLIENYFLNKPTGNSPEKAEAHYYCVMIARLLVDYFRSVFCEPKWKKPQGWESVLSTIRTSIFSSQNCELTLNEFGDLQITYLDGDPLGIKNNLKKLLDDRKKAGLNKVSWWGGRGVTIDIENRFQF